MRYLIISGLILILTSTRTLFAGTADSLVSAGNKAYSIEDYERAADLYEQVIHLGYESSELYYNIGNAYFKGSHFPEAILNYEKAKKLDPSDEDISFNLSLANSRIIDKIEPLPELFFKKWWKSLQNLFPVDTWALIGTVAFILVLIMAGLFLYSQYYFLRKVSFWAGIMLLAIMSFSLVSGIQGRNRYIRQNEAIIFTPTVTVKSSPNEKSVDLFVIHEGTKILITDKVEGWSEIRIANGNVGWVRSDVFRNI